MPKLHSSRRLRGLAILSIVPFLMGFEPHREEGLTVGVGGSYGRGHFSPACTNRIYEEEAMSGAASLEYTFAHDSARVWRPQVALGGRLGMARTETRLIADGEEGESPRIVHEPASLRLMGVTEMLLHLDWAYVGIHGGVVLGLPEWRQGDFDAPAYPVGELRLGPWKQVYMTAAVGTGTAMPVVHPMALSYGMGWQGTAFGLWLGRADTPYDASEARFALSYRLRPVTLLGSIGVFAEDEDASFIDPFHQGDFSQIALGLKFHL